MAPDEPTDHRPRFWTSWLLAGTHDSATTTMRRKIMQVNAGAAGIVLTILGFFAFYQWNGNEALVRTGWSQLPFVLPVPLVWRFNAQGRPDAARWTVFLIAMGGTLAAIFGGQGTALGAQIYFLLFAVLTVMFFPLAEWRWALLLTLLNSLLYAGLEHVGWPSHPSLAELSPELRRGISAALVAGCIGVVIGLAVMSEWAADVNERRLMTLADTDGLTGLLNRRALFTALSAELARSRRHAQGLAIGLIDLDHFKRVNDALGHDGGDAMLRHVTRVIRQAVRSHDLVGRVGGEEFVVLMPGSDGAQAQASMERLRDTVALQRLRHGNAWHAMTVSIGVAVLRPGALAEELLREADQALYRAKREGRNRVCAAAVPEAAPAPEPTLTD